MFKKGFTLIETLVVVAIIGLSLPVIFALFITTLQSQAKVAITQEVKRNGDYALDIIEHNIKASAYTIYSDAAQTTEVCTTRSSPSTPASSATVYFADKNNSLFYFSQLSDRIAWFAANQNPQTTYLTAPNVKVIDLSITCNRTASFSPPIISISFSVSQNEPSPRHEGTASLDYRTKIKLRSY